MLGGEEQEILQGTDVLAQRQQFLPELARVCQENPDINTIDGLAALSRNLESYFGSQHGRSEMEVGVRVLPALLFPTEIDLLDLNNFMNAWIKTRGWSLDVKGERRLQWDRANRGERDYIKYDGKTFFNPQVLTQGAALALLEFIEMNLIYQAAQTSPEDAKVLNMVAATAKLLSLELLNGKIDKDTYRVLLEKPIQEMGFELTPFSYSDLEED